MSLSPLLKGGFRKATSESGEEFPREVSVESVPRDELLGVFRVSWARMELALCTLANNWNAGNGNCWRPMA